MTRKVSIFSLALLCAAVLAPALAFAHGGGAHADGLLSGLAHPFGGPDHILVLLAVGIWAVRAGGRAGWGAPPALAGAVAASGLFAAYHGLAHGHGLPYTVGVLAATVLLNVLGAGAGLTLRRFERYFLARHAGPITAAIGVALYFV